MIERLIYRVLKDGIAQLAANPAILEDLFIGQHGLTAAEFASIKKLFLAQPPGVHHGYAHTENNFPLYAIILDSEGESTAFLAADAAPLPEDDPDYPSDVSSALWRHNYSILTYAEHPDVALYYYEIAKTIMFAARDFFVNESGLFNLVLSGMDFAPDPRYLPEHLFLRRLSFQCESEFQRVVTGKNLKAFKVRGIAVDSSGSPSDVGGVPTLVTVHEP